MANDERPDGVERYIDRWVAVQARSLDDTRRILQRMGESFQMGSYTPQTWTADVFELWDVSLRNAGAAWRAAWGVGGIPPPPRGERVNVVEVPRGVEGWQFSVGVDPSVLHEVGRAELGTPGFQPAAGGFSLEHPRNIDFDPAFLEPAEPGLVELTVALCTLPRELSPGCYSGPIEAQPVAGGDPITLAHVHVLVAERGAPPPQHRAASSQRDAQGGEPGR